MLNIKTNGVCLTLHEFENTPGRSKKNEARRTPSEEVRLPWVISVLFGCSWSCYWPLVPFAAATSISTST